MEPKWLPKYNQNLPRICTFAPGHHLGRPWHVLVPIWCPFDALWMRFGSQWLPKFDQNRSRICTFAPGHHLGRPWHVLVLIWCPFDAFWMTLVFVFPASVFRLFTHQTRHLVLSFNMENDQRIKAHLLRWFPAILYKYMIFGLAFLASVFRLLTYQTRHLVSSFNMENDQHIKARLLARFPAIFEKV